MSEAMSKDISLHLWCSGFTPLSLSVPLPTGGVFTRQAEVTFQPGGEKLTIHQEFKGIDEHDHLVVSTQLEGRIPEISPGASVQIDPYAEIFQYASNCESAVYRPCHDHLIVAAVI